MRLAGFLRSQHRHTVEQRLVSEAQAVQHENTGIFSSCVPISQNARRTIAEVLWLVYPYIKFF
jgi:hypothetical protein